MRIPLFGLGMLAKSPYVTAKLLTNMYVENRPGSGVVGMSPEKSMLVAYQRPGLSAPRINFGATPPRGALFFKNLSLSYIVHRGVLWEVNNAGVNTMRGNLNTQTGRVSMANNATQVIVVDGLNGYIYSTLPAIGTAQAITSITSSGQLATLTTAAPHALITGNIIVLTGNTPADYNGTYTVTVTGASTLTYKMLTSPGGAAGPVGAYTNPTFAVITSGMPANPTTVSYLVDTFFCTFAGKREVYASATDDGLFWDPLLFLGPGSSSTPTLLTWASNGILLVFSDLSTEQWAPSQQIGFPLAPQQGTAIEWGCAAIWSASKYDNTVALLMHNSTGEQMIASLGGVIPKQISSIDLDSVMATYANVQDASAYTFMRGGHQMYVINFDSAGMSWAYDESSGIWGPYKSLGLSRFRIEFAFLFLNQIWVADYATGVFYVLDFTALTDNGDSIEREIVGETLTNPDGEFIDVECLRVDCEVGDGLPNGQGANPQIALSISRDNAKTWGPDMWRTMGATGQYATRIEWRRLGGNQRQFTPRLRVTDPVPWVITSACINPPN